MTFEQFLVQFQYKEMKMNEDYEVETSLAEIYKYYYIVFLNIVFLKYKTIIFISPNMSSLKGDKHERIG